MATAKQPTERKNENDTEEKLSNASSTLSHAAKEARERFSDVEETLEDYVKANPWKAIGITLLAGVIVGEILHRR